MDFVLFYFLFCFVLFDLFVECFKFTQEDKVGVYLIETEFLGWTLIFKKKKKKKSHGFQNSILKVLYHWAVFWFA